MIANDMTTTTLTWHRNRPLALRVSVAILCLTGVLLILQAIWMDSKALLAQVLLDRAWNETKGGARDVRPWPWADTFPVARLHLIEEGASFVVLSGASGRTMAFGPGHVDGTSYPGDTGNVAIAGHRDTHFSSLRDARTGDRIDLDTSSGDRLHYRVTGAGVAHERDTSFLRLRGDRLTLITCYPFDAIRPGGPLRWVCS